DLAQALTRAIETAQPVIDARGHQLKTSVPLGAIFVEGDLIRLAQLVANLLTNAAKYTPEAGMILLEVEREKDTVAIRVKDSGVGIDPELLPRIFDLFVQGDHTLARSQGGLGIGLTLVKRLVDMHGGTISAVSNGKGQGSEFQIRFPVMKGDVSVLKPKASDRSRIDDAARRVLVI